ncbi:MAG: hypothetical protein KGN34_17640 [Sphingomonadales bacterium]|nr:hypothetical protein [Sphingomonadales bacterium]
MTFGTYFAMYAFRKPFAVASFHQMAFGVLPYKVALVIAQVVGYALAKMIGVKVVAELPARLRIVGILAQIAVAELALVLFALIPAPWNVACLFLNGLALGMVWGMVFGFVEGRRQSDLIGAMLCASLILSSGIVKSVGEWVLLDGIASPMWMPAVTGLIFVPLLALCLLGLAIMPPPSAADIAARVLRRPMDGPARKRLLREFAPGLAALVLIYVMLTALRDFRDNFAAEIWTEVGLGGNSGIFAWTEIPICFLVPAVLATQTLIRDNRTGLVANLALVGAGLLLAGLGSLAYSLHLLGPVAWMIAIGGGLYLAYTPFNGMLFDRLVAATGEVATAGFLIYVADASGYVGSVALVLLRSFDGVKLDWADFLVDVSLLTSVLGLVLLAYATVYFRGRLATRRHGLAAAA